VGWKRKGLSFREVFEAECTVSCVRSGEGVISKKFFVSAPKLGSDSFQLASKNAWPKSSATGTGYDQLDRRPKGLSSSTRETRTSR
jgi:hypothetical protein